MTAPGPAHRPRTLLYGVLVGVGAVGTLDEVVLHQVLDWHHFLDLSIREGGPVDDRVRSVGLLADGVFHLVSSLLLAVGLVGVWRDGRRPFHGWARRLWAGIAIGFGGFNLYDATIQHKVLRLHEVRRGVRDLVVYDLVFGGVALLVLITGVLLLRGAPTPRRSADQPPPR